MNVNRRNFLAAGFSAAAGAAQSGCGGPDDQNTTDVSAPGGPVDWAKVRRDFPRALNETYFNSAAQHPRVSQS